MEIGEGDLTTESVAPYPFHIKSELIARSDGILCGSEIVRLMFEPWQDQMQIENRVQEGESFRAGDVIMEIRGNGAEILRRRRLIGWLIGRLSGLLQSVQDTAEFLEKYGKRLVQGVTIDPVLEPLNKIAFQAGGGEWQRSGLYDSVYLTAAHIRYGGGIRKTLDTLNGELGPARKSLKIEVEINSFEQFKEINELDYDVLHLVRVSQAEIGRIFKQGNPIKKPILHLQTVDEFRQEYADYFFRYCAIEDLHRQPPYIATELIVNE